MKDGWHVVSGYNVYVENGKVLRGTLGEGITLRPAYIYRASRYGGWDKEEAVTVGAFRSAVNRGTMKLA